MKNGLFIRVPKSASSSILCALDNHTLHSAKRASNQSGKKGPTVFYVRTNNTINVIEKFNSEIDLKKFFTFGFVRNPWDRAVSSWKFGSHTGKKWNCTFNKFCHKLKTLNLNPETAENSLILHASEQHPFLLNKKLNLKVDFVGRFENLEEDLAIICDKIGIRHREIPYKNKSSHKHYTEYYDDKTRSLIAEKYAKDIEYFGYKFGG